MSKISLGVIGYGFVGKAVALGFFQIGGFDIFVHDPYLSIGNNTLYHRELSDPRDRFSLIEQASLEDIVKKCNVSFVCVPTPMYSSGESDTSIVEEVCKKVDEICNKLDKQFVLIIKSTVVPGTSSRIQSKMRKAKIVFNPEFLREETYLQDFIEQDRIVIGSANQQAAWDVEALYELFSMRRSSKYSDLHSMPTISVFTDFESAEMVKYTTNCFLATKISFANEIYQICQRLGINYDEMVEAATKDERLGKEYGWKVPGPIPIKNENGEDVSAFGYGLSCLPKDLNALIYYTKNNLGIEPKVMKAAWEKNLEVRPSAQRDWENMSKAFKKSEKK